MMVMDEYYYRKTHECFTIKHDIAKVCITRYAVDQLGDITYVQLPELQARFKKGQAFGEIESVKTVSELVAPLSGRVTEVNNDLAEHPELINEDSYDKGWLIRMEVEFCEEIQTCMTASGYREYLEDLS